MKMPKEVRNGLILIPSQDIGMITLILIQDFSL